MRRASEYGSEHIDGATNIPLHELVDRLGEVPSAETWVHCASGYRASIAASILAAQNRPVVLIDDDFDQAAGAAGLPMRQDPPTKG